MIKNRNFTYGLISIALLGNCYGADFSVNNSEELKAALISAANNNDISNNINLSNTTYSFREDINISGRNINNFIYNSLTKKDLIIIGQNTELESKTLLESKNYYNQTRAILDLKSNGGNLFIRNVDLAYNGGKEGEDGIRSSGFDNNTINNVKVFRCSMGIVINSNKNGLNIISNSEIYNNYFGINFSFSNSNQNIVIDSNFAQNTLPLSNASYVINNSFNNNGISASILFVNNINKDDHVLINNINKNDSFANDFSGVWKQTIDLTLLNNWLYGVKSTANQENIVFTGANNYKTLVKNLEYKNFINNQALTPEDSLFNSTITNKAAFKVISEYLNNNSLFVTNKFIGSTKNYNSISNNPNASILKTAEIQMDKNLQIDKNTSNTIDKNTTIITPVAPPAVPQLSNLDCSNEVLKNIKVANKWHMLKAPIEGCTIAKLKNKGATVVYPFDSLKNTYVVDENYPISKGEGFWIQSTTANNMNSIPAIPSSIHYTDCEYEVVNRIKSNNWNILGLNIEGCSIKGLKSQVRAIFR